MLALLLVLGTRADAAQWVATWGAAPLPPSPAMGPFPATPSFSNQTIRQVVRVSAGGDRVTWTLEAGPRMDPHLMSRVTYDVLAGGILREDNTVAYQGKVFGLGWRWSASGMVAEAIVIESAAA